MIHLLRSANCVLKMLNREATQHRYIIKEVSNIDIFLLLNILVYRFYYAISYRYFKKIINHYSEEQPHTLG